MYGSSLSKLYKHFNDPYCLNIILTLNSVSKRLQNVSVHFFQLFYSKTFDCKIKYQKLQGILHVLITRFIILYYATASQLDKDSDLYFSVPDSVLTNVIL